MKLHADDDIRGQLAAAPMSVRQWMAVAICVFINIVDGFEILAAAYTAPAIAAELGLSTRLAGMFLAAGPFGMVIGAFFLSLPADIRGRRFVGLLCLALCAIGMVGASLAVDLPILIAARVLTGVGVGAMMVAVNTVAAEIANLKHRDFALALQATGFPIGGALCGLLVTLLPFADWRNVYLTGWLVALTLIPLVILLLPESLAFLLERRPRNALQRLQRLAVFFNLDPVTALPASATVQETVPVRQLPRSGTLLISGSFFLMMFSFYFLSSWAPRLLAASGSATVALSGTALVSAGGVMGDLAFAGLATRWKAYVLGPVFACAAFLLALLLTASSSYAELVPPAALLLGFFMFGAMASHFAVVPAFFPANIRATGTGIAIGTGRVGAALGPLLGGVILSNGMPLLWNTAIMSAPLILCAFLLRTAGRHSLHH